MRKVYVDDGGAGVWTEKIARDRLGVYDRENAPLDAYTHTVYLDGSYLE